MEIGSTIEVKITRGNYYEGERIEYEKYVKATLLQFSTSTRGDNVGRYSSKIQAIVHFIETNVVDTADLDCIRDINDNT